MNEKGAQLSERLLDFAATLIKITDALPNTVAGRHVGGQLIRAGTSSGSNYEEACGAESRSDFAHKMSIVLKELKESRFWLRLIQRTQMLATKYTESPLTECEELCAIIARSIITTKRNKNHRNKPKVPLSNEN
ncbi:MAG TPA: four helix bundle protein [Thermodesulfobacteriota bacterium]|nr:four helix bundle protein [Thermodesulfobacteriota bacterium]